MGKNPTIKDVAQKANVSMATVSRVINNHKTVNAELTERVWSAIRETNFNPNHAARSLVKQKTNTIGIIVHNLHDPFFYDLIRGFEKGAEGTDYNIIFCSITGYNAEQKLQYLRYLRNGVVDAVVLYGSYHFDDGIIRFINTSDPINIVMIENEGIGLNCNKMLIDNYGGAQKAVQYLLQKGHRRIAHICGNPNKKVSVDRLNGYIFAMQQAGVEILSDYVQHTSTDSHSGYDKMRTLLELKNPPTAVFCSDDGIASYAVRAALDMGLRVPEDISVIGFDNRAFLPDGYKGPEITSVSQPLYDVGYDCIQLLCRQLNEGASECPFRKLYETTIVEKETVCHPK